MLQQNLAQLHARYGSHYVKVGKRRFFLSLLLRRHPLRCQFFPLACVASG